MKLARRIMWGGLLATLVLGWAAILTGGKLFGLGLFTGFSLGAASVGCALYASRTTGRK